MLFVWKIARRSHINFIRIYPSACVFPKTVVLHFLPTTSTTNELNVADDPPEEKYRAHWDALIVVSSRFHGCAPSAGRSETEGVRKRRTGGPGII